MGRVLRQRYHEVLVHTGQHYDAEMSDVFYKELEIPKPDYNLGVGSGSHGIQTGLILERVEEVLVEEQPDWVLVYGDTNSTLAGALAAAKLHLPVGHVEAGLRSHDRRMPEEINRIATDHLSRLLFAPTRSAVTNLGREGIRKGVHLVGDVMLDALQHAAQLADRKSNVLRRLGVTPQRYLLLTLHRPANVDEPRVLKQILQALVSIPHPIVFPVHPRTRKRLEEFHLAVPGNLRLTPPVGYLDFVALERNALRILTDSGGVQKEAYVLRVPCVTLRSTTEWTETLEGGWNTLVGTNSADIVRAALRPKPRKAPRPHYGRGDASRQIVRLLGHTKVPGA